MTTQSLKELDSALSYYSLRADLIKKYGTQAELQDVLAIVQGILVKMDELEQS